LALRPAIEKVTIAALTTLAQRASFVYFMLASSSAVRSASCLWVSIDSSTHGPRGGVEGLAQHRHPLHQRGQADHELPRYGPRAAGTRLAVEG